MHSELSRLTSSERRTSKVSRWDLESVNRGLDNKINDAYEVRKVQSELREGSLRESAFDAAVRRVAELIKVRSCVD